MCAYTRDWDETSPADHTKFKTQPQNVRYKAIDIAERLKNMIHGFITGETKEGIKKAPFVSDGTTAPSTAADTVVCYAKDVNSVAEWFLKDESGNEIQLTDKGKVKFASLGYVPNNTFVKALDTTGSGTVDLMKADSTGRPVLAGGALVDGTAAPASDYAIATKKYVDDNVVQAGMVVQDLCAIKQTVVDCSGAASWDNNAFLSSEGTEVLTLSITPKSATNKLIIELMSSGNCSGGAYVVMGLFQDSGASAIATSIQYASTSNDTNLFCLTYAMDAGTTSPTTFKMRIAPNDANHFYVNGKSDGALYDTTVCTSIRITEVTV